MLDVCFRGPATYVTVQSCDDCASALTLLSIWPSRMGRSKIHSSSRRYCGYYNGVGAQLPIPRNNHEKTLLVYFRVYNCLATDHGPIGWVHGHRGLICIVLLGLQRDRNLIYNCWDVLQFGRLEPIETLRRDNQTSLHHNVSFCIVGPT